jgi:apolipoprotein N-acyltransferase
VPLVAVAICYEIIFPGHVVDDLFRPDWIFNATNDAWFGSSIGPEQHLASARMRAIEEGLPVIRAANTGISAVIDANGEIVARLDTGETGIIDARMPSARPPTLYASFGDWMLLALILASWSWAMAANATARYRRMRKTVMQRCG